jgi:hypothetical protein
MTVSSQAYDALFDMVLDPTLLDLVLAMPDLSWRDVFVTIGTLLAWDIFTKPVVAFFWKHSRRHLSRGLFKLAVMIEPSVTSHLVPRPIPRAPAPFAV